MSVRCNDRQGRWRNRTVAFRTSDAEVRELDALVALSGLSKQDYITSRLLERDVIVVPSSRVQRALEDVSRDILIELRRINDAHELPLELREVMQILARILEGLGGIESVPETAVAEASMTNLQRATDVDYEPLETFDANWLIQQPRREPAWIAEDLVPTGLHLLTGAPKIGKSWLVLDLALAVNSGRPFWGYATRRCGVLYLALEDTLSRIQNRMWDLSDCLISPSTRAA